MAEEAVSTGVMSSYLLRPGTGTRPSVGVPPASVKEDARDRRLHGMKPRAFGALAALAAASLAAGCGGGGSGGSSSPTPYGGNGKPKAFVVLVTDINQLNDHGFNQLAYQGLKRAIKDLAIRGDVYQSASSQAYIPPRRGLLEDP